jgi:hypothetical protein
MPKSILETFGLAKVATYDASVHYGKKEALPETIDSDIEVGLEVEVENHILTHHPTAAWMSKGDGSLRNNGIEWITRPIAAQWAPHALNDLLGSALSKDCCFSPRTSIHVHLNMQSFDVSHVTDAVLLYTVFEPLFYKFTGRGRIKNIYCVPLMDTQLITAMNSQQLARSIELWSKYTGLNIMPIRELGTIEARHMHGTFDHRKVVIWIRLWIKLLEYVRKTGTAVIRRLLLELHQYSDYQQLMLDIWGQTDSMYLKYESWADISKSVNVVKRAFLMNTGSAELQRAVTKKSPYFTVGV